MAEERAQRRLAPTLRPNQLEEREIINAFAAT